MRTTAALGSLLALSAAVAGVAAVTSRPVPSAPPPAAKPVRLAVLVVFDQMRGDYLARWRPLFGPNGFARLQRDGAWFTHCHYPYGVSTTGPGHASMLTGACADAHGIVDNEWAENFGGPRVYCAGDPRYWFVPGAKPAKAKNAGTPERLKSETVADVLKVARGPGAKVFGLSLKDRSAILPTGRRPDGAYWFEGGAFGTSTYYRDRVHPWVESFNASKTADRWFGTDWTALLPEVDCDRWSGSADAEAGEGSGTGQGRTFPHPTAGAPALGAKYYEALARSPFGNELLLELAKTCIDAEGLGADDVPDLLVVSFSSNDLIGHMWGPDSHEVLDVTLRSDKIVADLLAFLDDRVGPGRYLLGLTADHGVCPLPEVSKARGVAPEAARVDTALMKKRIDAVLSAKFPALRPKDKDASWVDSIPAPWVNLNSKLIAATGKARAEIAELAAKALQPDPPKTDQDLRVVRTFTRAELAGTFPEADAVANRAKRSFHPSRCGDVYVVLEPYSLPAPRISTGTTHGSPYNYDTHVPLLVYGPGVRGGAQAEPTTPQAMASIFAKWLNVPRPKDAAFPLPKALE